jgi:hypothetical protein
LNELGSLADVLVLVEQNRRFFRPSFLLDALQLVIRNLLLDTFMFKQYQFRNGA